MKDLLVILFNSIFVNNIVLAQFLGICAFLGVSRNVKTGDGDESSCHLCNGKRDDYHLSDSSLYFSAK